MRKLVIAALLVLVVALFAQHYGGNTFSNVTVGGDVVVTVYQWLDIDFQLSAVGTVTDYGEQAEFDLGWFNIDSNAPVTVNFALTGEQYRESVNEDWGALPENFDTNWATGVAYIVRGSFDRVAVDGMELTDGTYHIIVKNGWVDKDLPAGQYKVTYELTFNPTVTF